MRKSVVEYLVCPYSGAPLKLEIHEQQGEHVTDGELISRDDQTHRYPIRRGIPRFADIDQLERDQRETIDSFSYKWSQIPSYAHGQSTKANRERWYFERFGFPRGDVDVRNFLGSAQFVLEAGTGTGVDTDLLARNLGGYLLGIDISRAIEFAYEKFQGRERVALFQADIGQLPFRPEFFDVISCDQVLHHTPDPPGNFKRLIRLLRPGGHILLYVYRIKGPLREYADDYLRGILTQGSLDSCLAFSEKVAKLGRNLSRLQAKVEIEDDIPELGISRGSYDVQRLIYDHIVKCFWNEDYDFKTNVMVNFDWYRPTHAFRYAENDIRGWAKEEGLVVEHWHVAPSGISGIMKKP